MTSHTPGPWFVEDDRRKRSRRPASMVTVVAQKGGMPGILVSQGEVTERDYANARLIAAAPKLLELLNEAAEFYNEGRVWTRDFANKVEAALAEAADAKA